MTDINDKTLSESLFAFNNRIVDMKDVIKKAKIFQNTKLVRQIKLLSKKKGNEAQLEKNKRKCEHLKEEIHHINKLKFNEIAIFSFDNDGVTFEQYIKENNKNLTMEKIALARVALSKQVIKATDNIKNDTKIQNWKHIFIKYKARCEKRKNWKEKNRLLKQIEAELKPENEQEEKEKNGEESEDDDEEMGKEGLNEDNEVSLDKKLSSENENKDAMEKIENPFIENTMKSKLKVEERTSKKMDREKNLKESSLKRKIKFSDDESLSNDDTESELNDKNSINGYDSHDDDKWNSEPEEDSNEDDFDDAGDDDDDDEDEEKSVDLNEKFVYSKSNLEKSSDRREKILKPLVIEQKPSHMVIKQINLDEIKDCEELSLGEIETQKKSETNLFKTIKAVEDPFFLDENGNEIKGDDNIHSFRKSYDFEQEPMSYSSYDRYGNRGQYKDRKFNSFKNSLSAENSEYKNFRRSNDTSFHRGNDRNFDHRDNNRPRYNTNNSNFKKSRNYNDKNKTYTNNRSTFGSRTDNKPKEDISKLHPSWQAKKIAEEKAKSLKFEGKKIKFDDE